MTTQALENRTEKKIERDRAQIKYIVENYRTPWVRARRPYVSQFLLNHSYYNGHQFVTMQNGHIVKRPRRRREVQIAHNHFKPTCRVVLGQVTKNRPILDVRALNTEGHIAEAEVLVARDVLKGIQLATHKPRFDQQIWLGNMKGGTMGLRTMWNSNRGAYKERIARDSDKRELHRDTRDNKVRNDEEVTEILARIIPEDRLEEPGIANEFYASRFTPVLEMGYEGDVEVDAYTLMEWMADPSFWNLEEADMMIIERFRTMRYIHEHFPKWGQAVKPEGDVPLLFDSAGYSSLLPGAGLSRVTGQPTEDQGRVDGAVLRELIIKPTKRNPLSAKNLMEQILPDTKLKEAEFGVHFVWAGDVVLQDETNPMPYAKTPGTDQVDVNFDMVDYRWMPEPGLWGSPMLTDAVPLQNAINARRGMIISALNTHTYSKLLRPTSSMIAPDTNSNLPGEEIVYSGVPPSYLQPPTIPSHLFRAMEDDIKQFNDVLMLHEVSREGRVPAQVRTASALLRLQETDNLALAPILQLWEDSEQQVGQRLLDRTNQFYEDGRLVKFVGERKKLEVAVFKRGELFQNRASVYVHEGSSLPDSNAARLQMVFEMLQFAPQMFIDRTTGAFDPAKVARVMNLPSFDEFLEDIDESRQAAVRENHLIEEGGPQIQPLPTDEDAIHLEAHYPIIRSPDFREWPEERQNVLIEHAALHEQRLFQKVQNAGQTTQMMEDTASNAAADVAEPGPSIEDLVTTIATAVAELGEGSGVVQ